MPISQDAKFVPLHIAMLTISDTRTLETDSSGSMLADCIEHAGHYIRRREIVKDNVYQIRATVSKWIADENVQVVISTGGTGFSGRDSTPEAISPLLDKQIDGFGELFRAVSLSEIGTSTVQSRAFAGMANYTLLFCLPGSTNACQTAWKHILVEQLDSRFKPCNFVSHLKSVTSDE